MPSAAIGTQAGSLYAGDGEMMLKFEGCIVRFYPVCENTVFKSGTRTLWGPQIHALTRFACHLGVRWGWGGAGWIVEKSFGGEPFRGDFAYEAKYAPSPRPKKFSASFSRRRVHGRVGVGTPQPLARVAGPACRMRHIFRVDA